MINIDDYLYLPEAIEQIEIEKKLLDILERFSNDKSPDVLDCIWELVVRQGNNPGLLSNGVSEKLSDYLMLAWDKNSPEITDSCLSIASNMELENFYQHVLSEEKKLSNNEVIKHIQAYKTEFGFSVNNT